VDLALQYPEWQHTAQLVRYSFAPTWGCHLSTTPGFTLGTYTATGTPDTPNRLDACAAVEHSSFTQQCEFECDAGYQPNNGGCVHKCAGMALSCAPLYYASVTCVAGPEHWYSCVPCTLQDGFGVASFSTRATKSECPETQCAAGSFGADGICQLCAPHTYSTAGQSACTPCVRGEFQPTAGSSVCLPCFPVPASAPTCPDGQELHESMASVDEYFTLGYSALLDSNVPEDAALLLHYCAQGHACLPCRPGQYSSESGCRACPEGQYQPHFEATACFECSADQTTADSGATSSAACICQPGFQ
jgi:hypothetical protein